MRFNIFPPEGLNSIEPKFHVESRAILKTIERAKGNKDIPFSVFKTTGIMSSEVLESASLVIENNGVSDISLVENQLESQLIPDWQKLMKKETL